MAITLNDAADIRHQKSIEAWGDGIALKLGAVCRWARARGVEVDCPASPGGRQQ